MIAKNCPDLLSNFGEPGDGVEDLDLGKLSTSTKSKKSKSNKIRVGSPEELEQLQSFITTDLSPNRIVEPRKVGELLELLVLLQNSSDAAVLQNAYGEYCKKHDKAASSAAVSDTRWKLEMLRQ